MNTTQNEPDQPTGRRADHAHEAFTDEDVEAAAEAMVHLRWPEDEKIFDGDKQVARAALAAVAPAIAARALRDAMPTVNHSVQSEAQVLVDAAWKLRNDYPAGGSNVRAAIATLLDRVAAAHDPATSTAYEGHPSRAEQRAARAAEVAADHG